MDPLDQEFHGVAEIAGHPFLVEDRGFRIAGFEKERDRWISGWHCAQTVADWKDSSPRPSPGNAANSNPIPNTSNQTRERIGMAGSPYRW